MKIDLTIDDIDEEVLAKVRNHASAIGKTVEQLVEEFLSVWPITLSWMCQQKNPKPPEGFTLGEVSAAETPPAAYALRILPRKFPPAPGLLSWP